ncbi:putative serine/threonine-protein kinase [Aphis craccivora]|uniref:Putative serine/threonine-protein kinase n=1 Tax=Aphis craccivora TaxID=307492 RepID=A0A6G0YS15_APHCR|nr:putative serine/threonine-protein kinase [Aphis craccivora]
MFILNYMWKHLNIRDKHKYYETATKARTMYNLPELPYHAEYNMLLLKKKKKASLLSLKSSFQIYLIKFQLS